MPKPIRFPRREPRVSRSAVVRRTEEALREAERRYQSIFENAVEGIFQTTPDGRYQDANPALARMYGYDTPAELMAALTNIAEQLYIDPERRAEFEIEILAHGLVKGFESRVRRRDGSVIWISENTRAIRDASGRLLRYEGTVEDVTPRKLAEEALRETEERYALAVRAASEGLWDWNLSTQRVYYSPRWKAMLGCAEHEIGETLEGWLERLHPDDQSRIRSELETHLAGKTTHFESEFRLRHQDGSWRWMLSRGIAVFDDGGPTAPHGRLAVRRDEAEGRRGAPRPRRLPRHAHGAPEPCALRRTVSVARSGAHAGTETTPSRSSSSISIA